MSDNLYSFWEEKYKNMDCILDFVPDSVIADYFEYMPKGKVLDLGIGQGKNSLFFAANGYKVVGVDISETSVHKLREIAKKEKLNMDIKAADIRKIEFNEAEYEIIISTAVLHYVKKSEVKKIIQNVIKSLITGGFVYISVFSCDDPTFKTQLKSKEVQVVGENEIFYLKAEYTEAIFQRMKCWSILKILNL